MSKQKSKQQAQNSSVVAVQQATYSGPIPPPAAMEQYERIVPGAANRILAMAEREQEARHEFMASERRLRHRGQWIGALLVLLLIGASVYFAYVGLAVLAGTVMGVTLLGVATIFVLGKKGEQQQK